MNVPPARPPSDSVMFAVEEAVGAAEAALVLPARPRGRFRKAATTHFRSYPVAGGALGVAIVGILLALIGPSIAPHDPEVPDPSLSLTGPSFAHPFGVDASGFDIFSRCLAAPRTDLGISLVASLIAFVLGIVLGTLAGYYQGTRSLQSVLGEALLRIADIIQSFPVFILALGLVAMRGAGALNVIIALTFVNFPVYLRLIRSETLSIRERAFIDAARVAGLSDLRIALKHILPNALGPASVLVSVSVGFGILLTAGLSFIGAGVRPPTPELGSMVASGADSIITGQWWPVVFPGLVIGIIVLAFSVVGETLEHLLDPRNRA